MTRSQLADSANAPWTRTIVGCMREVLSLGDRRCTREERAGAPVVAGSVGRVGPVRLRKGPRGAGGGPKVLRPPRERVRHGVGVRSAGALGVRADVAVVEVARRGVVGR